MRYRRKQFFTSVSVEMLIWLLYFYVISFLPVRSISATLSWLLLFAVEYVFNYSILNVVPCAKMCHFFNSVVLQLSFSGKILYLKQWFWGICQFCQRVLKGQYRVKKKLKIILILDVYCWGFSQALEIVIKQRSVCDKSC